MSKLRKADNNEWMKCCRYCKHFSEGYCTNDGNITFGEDMSVYKVAENGHLAVTLEHTFGGIDILDEFKELDVVLRDLKISGKNLESVHQTLTECWIDFKERMKKYLEESVSTCYNLHITDDSSFGKVYIENPEYFCCKDWC